MTHSIEAIARATGLAAEGDLSVLVGRPASPGEAGPDDLAIATSEQYGQALAGSGVRAAVLWNGADWRALGLEAALFAPRPRVAIAAINEVFDRLPEMAGGVHAMAVVDPTATLGQDVRVGPFTVIGAGAVIGDGARILGQVWIGRNAKLGANALLHPGVRIGHDCTIGARFVAQPNAVIGGDGFSFVTPDTGSAETAKAGGEVTEGQNTVLRRINSLGAVTIGDDVEIGAISAIDRGTIADTTVGSGTKIDNQVQIGHNVQIGENCLICGQVGIAGSVVVGDRVVLGGRTGIADNVKVGSDSVMAGGSMVASNVQPRAVMMGVPAQTRDKFGREMMAIRRLPRMIDQVREIRTKLGL